MAEIVINIKGLKNFLGGHWVHDGVDLAVERGTIVGIVGGSGCGKTTLMRSILQLLIPTAGDIEVFGTDILRCSPLAAMAVRQRWGVLFQHGALFSSLSVLDNVCFPMAEFTKLSSSLQTEWGRLKIALAGLPSDAAIKYPSELSGGMQKRAALARAIALDPELLFLDEPSAGLDPHSADALDTLILNLRDQLGLTVVMITHDLDSLCHVTDKVAFLGEGRVLAYESMSDLMQHAHPMIRDYFSGPRGEARQRLTRQGDQ